MEGLERQTKSYVDAYNDPDNVSWSDSRFYNGSRRAFRDRACTATVSWSGVVAFWRFGGRFSCIISNAVGILTFVHNNRTVL